MNQTKKKIAIFAITALAFGGAIIVYNLDDVYAVSSKNFRINLKDGRVTANENGFGRFNEHNSGPFGKATTNDPLCLVSFPGQYNWNGDLEIYLECKNDRQGPNKLEGHWLYTNGYDKVGHSYSSGHYSGRGLDVNHWKILCSLYVANKNNVPMLSQTSITNPHTWQVYAITNDTVSKYTHYDYFLSNNKPAIVNKIRVTGDRQINFDVKILPVIAAIEDCCTGNVTYDFLSRPGTSR